MTEDFDVHYPIYYQNWRNISIIYIYNKTSIKRNILRGAGKSLARPGRKQATATEDFDVHYPIYYQNWRNISTIYIYIYITRLASNEIFSPTNKMHREVGRSKDLSVQ